MTSRIMFDWPHKVSSRNANWKIYTLMFKSSPDIDEQIDMPLAYYLVPSMYIGAKWPL